MLADQVHVFYVPMNQGLFLNIEAMKENLSHAVAMQTNQSVECGQFECSFQDKKIGSCKMNVNEDMQDVHGKHYVSFLHSYMVSLGYWEP